MIRPWWKPELSEFSPKRIRMHWRQGRESQFHACCRVWFFARMWFFDLVPFGDQIRNWLVNGRLAKKLRRKGTSHVMCPCHQAAFYLRAWSPKYGTCVPCDWMQLGDERCVRCGNRDMLTNVMKRYRAYRGRDGRVYKSRTPEWVSLEDPNKVVRYG